MINNEVQSGNLKFSIDSSLLFELGERLVTRPSIALAELVKNAYDADSTKVIVTFEQVSKPGGVIMIEDDGHGMTFEEIKTSWMRIATSRKRLKPVSKIYCRALSGAKGIGRLAARRLGSSLLLQSVATREDGIKESVTVNFDWKESFLPGEDLENVSVSYKRQKVETNSKTGVYLFIGGVRDAWTEDEIRNLLGDLLSVQNPFPDLLVAPKHNEENRCSPDPGFNFDLFVDGSERLNKFSGGLGDAFLKAAWAKLEGVVDERGKAHYDINIGRNQESDSFIDATNLYLGLEDARFRIYYMVYKKEYFNEQNFGVQNASRKGREEGGVRIYLDGFRVFPYGDPGDDWLQLEEYGAKNIDMASLISPTMDVMELAGSLNRPFLLIPKNSQLFGVVSISQTKHMGIEINVTRDRLIETPTVTKLQRFVQNGIYWMTLKYASSLAEERIFHKEEQPQPQKVLDIIEDVKVVISTEKGIPEEKRQAIIGTLDRAIQQSRVDTEERISEISMLRVLASAGTTLALMNHQLQAIIGAVLQTEQDLIRLRPKISEDLYPQYDDIVNQISEWHEMVKLQISQLGFLLSAESRQRRRRHPLYQIVENVRKPMSFYMKKYGVAFENNVSRSLRTPPIYESELYAVLINILSNALKAVFTQSERRISVEAEKTDQALYLRMLDTGVGVPVELRENAFRPFFTTSLPNPVLGVGTGLGLTVVRELLEVYNGTARFVNAKSPWKTQIEIVLPERGTSNDQ